MGIDIFQVSSRRPLSSSANSLAAFRNMVGFLIEKSTGTEHFQREIIEEEAMKNGILNHMREFLKTNYTFTEPAINAALSDKGSDRLILESETYQLRMVRTIYDVGESSTAIGDFECHAKISSTGIEGTDTPLIELWLAVKVNEQGIRYIGTHWSTEILQLQNNSVTSSHIVHPEKYLIEAQVNLGQVLQSLISGDFQECQSVYLRDERTYSGPSQLSLVVQLFNIGFYCALVEVGFSIELKAPSIAEMLMKGLERKYTLEALLDIAKEKFISIFRILDTDEQIKLLMILTNLLTMDCKNAVDFFKLHPDKLQQEETQAIGDDFIRNTAAWIGYAIHVLQSALLEVVSREVLLQHIIKSTALTQDTGFDTSQHQARKSFSTESDEREADRSVKRKVSIGAESEPEPVVVYSRLVVDACHALKDMQSQAYKDPSEQEIGDLNFYREYLVKMSHPKSKDNPFRNQFLGVWGVISEKSLDFLRSTIKSSPKKRKVSDSNDDLQGILSSGDEVAAEDSGSISSEQVVPVSMNQALLLAHVQLGMRFGSLSSSRQLGFNPEDLHKTIIQLLNQTVATLLMKREMRLSDRSVVGGDPGHVTTLERLRSFMEDELREDLLGENVQFDILIVNCIEFLSEFVKTLGEVTLKKLTAILNSKELKSSMAAVFWMSDHPDYFMAKYPGQFDTELVVRTAFLYWTTIRMLQDAIIGNFHGQTIFQDFEPIEFPQLSQDSQQVFQTVLFNLCSIDLTVAYKPLLGEKDISNTRKMLGVQVPRHRISKPADEVLGLPSLPQPIAEGYIQHYRSKLQPLLLRIHYLEKLALVCQNLPFPRLSDGFTLTVVILQFLRMFPDERKQFIPAGMIGVETTTAFLSIIQGLQIVINPSTSQQLHQRVWEGFMNGAVSSVFSSDVALKAYTILYPDRKDISYSEAAKIFALPFMLAIARMVWDTVSLHSKERIFKKIPQFGNGIRHGIDFGFDMLTYGGLFNAAYLRAFGASSHQFFLLIPSVIFALLHQTPIRQTTKVFLDFLVISYVLSVLFADKSQNNDASFVGPLREIEIALSLFSSFFLLMYYSKKHQRFAVDPDEVRILNDSSDSMRSLSAVSHEYDPLLRSSSGRYTQGRSAHGSAERGGIMDDPSGSASNLQRILASNVAAAQQALYSHPSHRSSMARSVDRLPDDSRLTTDRKLSSVSYGSYTSGSTSLAATSVVHHIERRGTEGSAETGVKIGDPAGSVSISNMERHLASNFAAVQQVLLTSAAASTSHHRKMSDVSGSSHVSRIPSIEFLYQVSQLRASSSSLSRPTKPLAPSSSSIVRPEASVPSSPVRRLREERPRSRSYSGHGLRVPRAHFADDSRDQDGKAEVAAAPAVGRRPSPSD